MDLNAFDASSLPDELRDSFRRPMLVVLEGFAQRRAHRAARGTAGFT
jgi:hypothetical protein